MRQSLRSRGEKGVRWNDEMPYLPKMCTEIMSSALGRDRSGVAVLRPMQVTERDPELLSVIRVDLDRPTHLANQSIDQPQTGGFEAVLLGLVPQFYSPALYDQLESIIGKRPQGDTDPAIISGGDRVFQAIDEEFGQQEA